MITQSVQDSAPEKISTLHIIEPTLQDESGHCCSYVTSLIEACNNADLKIELWIGKAAAYLFPQDSIKVHAIFSRRLRLIQTWYICYKLLKDNQAIFIPTAGRIDMVMLQCLLKNKTEKNNIFLHFHQFKITQNKLKYLRKISQILPGINILTPTKKLIDIFVESGFKRCNIVPCPSYTRDNLKIQTTGRFSNLLYAGPARSDKGFSDVVRFVRYILANKIRIPIAIQISPDYSGRYDKLTQLALQQLEDIDNPLITIYRNPLPRDFFQRLFKDAICLQLYDNKSYANKFSSITLDALYAGCPIITTNGTWIAETVKRFDAGIILEDISNENMLDAINQMINMFSKFQLNALKAGQILRKEHNPSFTLETIKHLYN